MPGQSPDYPIEKSAAYWDALLQPPTELTSRQRSAFLKNLTPTDDLETLQGGDIAARIRIRAEKLRQQEEKKMLTATWDSLFEGDE